MPEPINHLLDTKTPEHVVSLATADRHSTLNSDVGALQQSPLLGDGKEVSQNLGRVLVPDSSSPTPSPDSNVPGDGVDGSDAAIPSDFDTARIIDPVDLPLSHDGSFVASNPPRGLGTSEEDVVPETPDANLDSTSANHAGACLNDAYEAQLVEASLINAPATPSTARVVSTPLSGRKRRRSISR
jgi:hypothetical protein